MASACPSALAYLLALAAACPSVSALAYLLASAYL
jgi:hypothetical protein